MTHIQGQPWRGAAAVLLLCSGAALLVAACALIVAGACGFVPQLAFGRALGGMGAVGATVLVVSACALVSTVASGVRIWRRSLACCVVALSGALLVVLFPPRWALALAHDPAGPVFYVETAEPHVALTIDDGLSPNTTPTILEVLRRHGAHATFFVLSDSLDGNRDLAARILAEGHELANHQTSAAPAATLTNDEMAAEIANADRALRELAPVRWFRPGGGYVTRETIQEARNCGCAVALGSVFPFDSHAPWTRFVAAYVAHRPVPGDIIVLHDGPERGQRTAAALDAALPRLAERGLRCVTLSELAGATDRAAPQ